MPQAMRDFAMENHGSIILLRMLTPEAKRWVEENVSEERLIFGDALVVEPRYLEALVEGAEGDGLRF